MCDILWHLYVGGSLTVQIFGASSPTVSGERKRSNKNGDDFMVSDKQNTLSGYPIVVSSRKDDSNILKK